MLGALKLPLRRRGTSLVLSARAPGPSLYVHRPIQPALLRCLPPLLSLLHPSFYRARFPSLLVPNRLLGLHALILNTSLLPRALSVAPSHSVTRSHALTSRLAPCAGTALPAARQARLRSRAASRPSCLAASLLICRYSEFRFACRACFRARARTHGNVVGGAHAVRYFLCFGVAPVRGRRVCKRASLPPLSPPLPVTSTFPLALAAALRCKMRENIGSPAS